MIRDELPDGGTGAFLIWGDPTLYDGTLDMINEIIARRTMPLRCEVVPGISSVSALAARHQVALHHVGQPVQITTGRLLARDGMPSDIDDVTVMLDQHTSFADLPDDDLEIYWGARISACPTSCCDPGPSRRRHRRSSPCAPKRADGRGGSWTPTCCADVPPESRRRATCGVAVTAAGVR